MRRTRLPLMAACLCAIATSCSAPSDEAINPRPDDPIDASCVLPGEPTVVLQNGAAVLLTWEFAAADVYSQPVVPADSAFLSYRAAIRADGGDLRNPIADPPDPQTDAEIEMWLDEDFNHDLAQAGAVGVLEPIRCLDALLFAYQNSRIPQLESPTEFLASVLRRDVDGQPRLALVFGAGDELFPPKTVYGFDVVEEYLAEGWSYWYALHNHTTQPNGSLLALGNPTLSTSDVQITRNVVNDLELEGARVTNGFYTYSLGAEELVHFRSR